ncbi:MAG: YkgJ family cysteine cluster protein [Rubripirellula sp.]
MRSLPTINDCGDCGACCMHMGFPPYMGMSEGETPEEFWKVMPDDLKSELLAYMSSYSPPAEGELDGPCVWLDSSTKLCKHHEHRPRVCRDFQVGSQGCLEWRDAYQIDSK